MTQTVFIGGNELKDIYEKISRKQRRSKNYKQLLKFKYGKINEVKEIGKPNLD